MYTTTTKPTDFLSHTQKSDVTFALYSKESKINFLSKMQKKESL